MRKKEKTTDLIKVNRRINTRNYNHIKKEAKYHNLDHQVIRNKITQIIRVVTQV